jgi:hypothetical protein
MAKLAPPPPTNQDVASRQFRDWFYSVFQFINQQTGTLGTMAYENANSVAITGGAIGGVGISGSTINSTPIGQSTSAAGKFTALEATASLKTDTLTGYLYGNGSGSNVSASTTIPSGSISGLGTMATQNANAVAITGGTITGVNLSGSSIPYSNVTGLATVAHTGAYSDLTGTPTGVSVTITTAKLTTLGTNGSMTFTNGILTSQTQAT